MLNITAYYRIYTSRVVGVIRRHQFHNPHSSNHSGVQASSSGDIGTVFGELKSQRNYGRRVNSMPVPPSYQMLVGSGRNATSTYTPRPVTAVGFSELRNLDMPLD